MSGAGKSTALKMMEDFGYYCVDNLPIQLIENFTDLAAVNDEVQKIALGIDIRGMTNIREMPEVLEKLRERKVDFEVLYLDADDATLIKRYKETRRSHPLAAGERVDKGIGKERQELDFLKGEANFIIDTSKLLTRELKSEMEQMFVKNQGFKSLFISIVSFGFKYGIPSDSDLVFDVRFLPNPYYIDELKPKNGNDIEVQEYVKGFPQTVEFMDKLVGMIEFLIPHYVDEGKNQLVISIGCTGGKHRSVTLANELYEKLSIKKEYGLRIEHRDIGKDAIRKK